MRSFVHPFKFMNVVIPSQDESILSYLFQPPIRSNSRYIRYHDVHKQPLFYYFFAQTLSTKKKRKGPSLSLTLSLPSPKTRRWRVADHYDPSISYIIPKYEPPFHGRYHTRNPRTCSTSKQSFWRRYSRIPSAFTVGGRTIIYS